MALIFILLTILSVGLCEREGVPERNLGRVDPDENMVEPRLDFWQVFNKARGKSTLKNLIMSLQQYDAQKTFSQPKSLIKIKPIDKKITENPSDKITHFPPPSTTNIENIYTTTVSGPIDQSKIIKNLQLQHEEKNHFLHSIVDGWTF